MVKANSSKLGLDDVDLSGFLDETQQEAGFMELDLSSIDEDPDQPRTDENPGFSKASLSELASTIKARGVKTPISVRDGKESGRYIINHGARRYRASKLAGKTTIPAFLDNDYLEEDQVIENIQRDELTSREIAGYIGRQVRSGIKKSEVAKKLGKSPAYVTQHLTLLDLPEPISDLYQSGALSDVTVINDLVGLFKRFPEEVGSWASEAGQEFTRGAVRLLKEFLEERERDPKTIDALTGKSDDEKAQEQQRDLSQGETQDPKDQDPKEQETSTAKKPNNSTASDPDKFKKAIVCIEYDSRAGRIELTKRPSSEGLAWIKLDDDGHELEVKLNEITLTAVMEG